MGPPHSGLWCDTSWKLFCLYAMPHYASGCRISTLIMKPINFWRNSDLLKKKNIFLAQKLTKLEHCKENLWNFSKKISQIHSINLWNIFGATVMILSVKLNNFGFIWLWNDLFGLKCHIAMFQSPVCVCVWGNTQWWSFNISVWVAEWVDVWPDGWKNWN